jgi:uncharacterized membrane protein YukC
VRLYRLSGRQYLELDKLDPAIERFNLALDARSFDETLELMPSIEYEAAVVYANISALEHKRRNYDLANDAKQKAFKSLELVVNSTDSTPELKQKADSFKHSIEQR